MVSKPLKAGKPVPAVSPRRSVHRDKIVCLEDGKRFKSLKRHLMVHHGLTPDQYRKKWALSRNYPMVAANYSARRSEIAKGQWVEEKRAEHLLKRRLPHKS
jgi:predicted transcriptional regulator